MLAQNTEASHCETAHSLCSMSILVLQNFKWNLEHWLVGLIWIFLSSEWSVSFGFKICKSYWSCQCAMQSHGARDTYLALSDLFVDWWSEWQLSHDELSSWESNKILTACNPETDLLKAQLQMGKLLAWPFEANYSMKGSGLSWDLSFYNPACSEPVCIVTVVPQNLPNF